MRKQMVLAVALMLAAIFLTCVERVWGEPAVQEGPKQAGTSPAAEKEKKWTIEDVIMVEEGDQFRISPDSKWAVWVKHSPDTDKDGMVLNLFLSSLTEKKEIQLTRGTDRNSSPKWSPDSQLIAFISNRPLPKAKEGPASGEPSPTQLWLINPFGGEPWPLTRSERSVKDFDWIDSGTILIAAEEDPSLYERTFKERKDASRAVEDAAHTPPVRLFKINVKSQEVTRVTDNNDWIEDVAVSPDGKKVVTVHARSLSYQFDQRIKPVTFLYDLASGSGKQLFADGKVVPFRIRWTLDSSGFYAISLYSTHPIYREATVNHLYYYDLAADKTIQVDLGWENELGPDYAITKDGFLALLAAGSRFKPARYTRSGDSWSRAWIEGEHANNIFGIELGRDGQTLVYEASSASRPGQWYCAALEGANLVKPAQLTDLNPTLQKKTAAKAEVIRWKGALDEEVEGILYYPHNYEPGKKYPLVLIIHGGPTGFDMDAWDENWAAPTNLLSQRGAFVLKPNYHGSGNYGLKWAESIGGGKYYDLEVPDIEAGVDYLIARGLVDPDRLGTMGWSNGAILTVALTVNSTRYKVASAGAGDVEWISDWGNVDFGAAFDNYYLGKSPVEDPELYIRKSPLFKMKDVRTPTIIFFGTEDRNVPTSQGWTHFRTLQQLGQTEVRFFLFPGEAHGPRKLTHQRRKVEEELAWFDKYLFKPGEAKNEAFKEDSPLGLELKRQKIKKVEGKYGVLEKKTVIPDVVSYEGIELGRFELTRAQYAAFDKNYRVDQGTENYPANGISFENAKAYCAWLSKLTGQTYRLGNEEELEPIYRTARRTASAENTLDYWAGYALNPDDAARLGQKTKELPGATPLLKEVGSFKGVGEELVFDLGGNVAEWVAAKDGTGKAMGGSADQPADPKAATRAPGQAYIGFRVIRGERKPAERKP
jgi:dipeptidyl aminopeptidase/acylaminoacyl peptidase